MTSTGSPTRSVRSVLGTPSSRSACALGLLGPGQAARIKEAGAFAYNHNLNTAASFYGDICTTHTFDDRVSTVREAAEAGLSPCSGVIVGMGEPDTSLVDVAFALRELRPASVPVNFLCAFRGNATCGARRAHADAVPARACDVPLCLPRRRGAYRWRA